MAFDLRTEIRDPKTGKTVHFQNYIRHVSVSGGEWFEREGKCFDLTGKEIPDPRVKVEAKHKVDTIVRAG